MISRMYGMELIEFCWEFENDKLMYNMYRSNI